MKIAEATEIELHFALKLEDGSVIDTTFDRQPARFVFGDGSLLPGIEVKLLGLSSGYAGEIVIAPEDGFGQRNDANIHRFHRSQFKDVNLEPGLVLSFDDAKKQQRPGVVAEFNDEQVTIDFNHPLAGKTLLFEVSILSVAAASNSQ